MGNIMRMVEGLLVLPSTINGTELESQEWMDSLFLCYKIEPPDLADHCDGCGAAFNICHALDCNKEGLIISCHNDLHDGIADLASKVVTPTHVCNDPKIYTSCTVRGGKGKLKFYPSKENGGLKGYLLIRDL